MVRVKTPAKVNLFLRVLARRADGYHDIETLFQAIGLEDELLIEKSQRDVILDAPGFHELENERNLVIRALRWIEAQIGSKLPVRLKLNKRIPVAAGLGGGSSDAAAALVGISRLFDLDLPQDVIARGAAALGADVPFFLIGGAAAGEGIGDRLAPVDLPADYGVMLVSPGFPVSTAAVYREFSRGLTGEAREGKLWNMVRGVRDLKDILYNDLETAATRLYPQLSDIRESLIRAGLERPLMSGSGPTFFALGDPDELRKIVGRLPAKLKTFMTRPVTHGPRFD